MKKLLFCFVLSLILFPYHVMGESMNMSKPEITLSNVVPVVNQELEIRLWNLASTEKEAAVVIAYEGKDILREEIKSVDGRFTKKWTPAETGFYTASFKSKQGETTLEFPVVYKEIYFYIWPNITPSEKNLKYLSSYIGCEEKDIAYWKSRGSRTLAYIYQPGGRIDMEKDEEEVINQLAAKWSAPIKQGYDGIFIDEFGGYPLPDSLRMVERTRKALIKLRKENPDMLIFPANSGALLREAAISYKYSDSIALLETYNNCFEQAFGTHSFKQHLDYRIMVARNTDLIYERGRKHGAIILLGMGCNGGGMLIPHLEDMVRYTKKTAPEMPGIGFYVGGREKQWTIDVGLRQAAEDFCLKYYIKPVVDMREIWLSNHTPAAGEEIDIFVRVHNLGGMDAKNVKVRLYAVESGSGKKIPIGKEIIIKKIGTGYVDIKLARQDKPQTYYEYQEINGNTYPIFQTVPQGTNIIFIDRTTVKVSWESRKKGYYTITAELEPSDNYTILDGIMKKDICVTGKAK